MKLFNAGAIAVVIGFLTVMPASSEEEGGAARGREIAEAACAPCHAIGRSGTSPNPKATPFREIGRNYPVDNLEETLAEGVVTGHPEMPKVKMTPKDIGAFIAYLRTIQQ
ncbi:c-type cytochrome [Methyloraptor flagellatus]|jgi:mono/diheme cytochrome c family protein|uniref:Cytochrome c n=1 Tax=Methyloraptor flagellatus TaxID=3162530 RepID=A0AAU7XBN2_9HYPH